MRKGQVLNSAAEPFDTTSSSKTGLVPVFLDGNVWNYMFDRGLALDVELPPDRFSLAITRESEMELVAIPAEKNGLRDFIMTAIAERPIPIDSWFGWNVESLPPDEQRNGGFGFGRWASQGEVKFYHDLQNEIRKTKKRSKLFANEGDVALASRSSHSLVLSLDAKAGPLKIAQALGGKVCFLTGLAPPRTIGEFVNEYVVANGLTF